MTSIIYRYPLIYWAVIRILYGRHYNDRYKAISELIPTGARVVELCMGDAVLYRYYLKQKSVDYLGLDISRFFIRHASMLDINCRVHDLRCDSIPSADYVIIQASLYQFIDVIDEVMEKLFEACREKLIITEPIKNIANSKFRLISSMAGFLTDAGSGSSNNRFDELSILALFERYGQYLEKKFLIPGGREMVGIFSPQLDEDENTKV